MLCLARFSRHHDDPPPRSEAETPDSCDGGLETCRARDASQAACPRLHLLTLLPPTGSEDNIQMKPVIASVLLSICPASCRIPPAHDSCNDQHVPTQVREGLPLRMVAMVNLWCSSDPTRDPASVVSTSDCPRTALTLLVAFSDHGALIQNVNRRRFPKRQPDYRQNATTTKIILIAIS